MAVNFSNSGIDDINMEYSDWMVTCQGSQSTGKHGINRAEIFQTVEEKKAIDDTLGKNKHPEIGSHSILLKSVFPDPLPQHCAILH